MGIFLYSIIFELQYNCYYGDCVYVIGNIPELGDWQISKALKLKCREKNIWCQRLNVKSDNSAFIQYKYVIASNNNFNDEIKRWECGSNRILALKNITKLEFILKDIWNFRMVSIRLNKQENTNPIYISGNTFDLGSYNTLKVMSIIRKKTSLFIDESYWEKLILLPMDFSSDLFYNFYEFDKENKCILVNEMNFSANLLEDLRFPSFENLWSPQISPKKKLSNFKVATLSPFKLLAARNIGNNMTINMNKNKPKRIEKKFNYFIVYNELNEMNSFIKELNNEIIIGNNCLNPSDIILLEKQKIDSVVIFRNMHARINESYRTYEESVNKFCKNLEITPYTIYKNQINRDDPSNLLAWADSLDNLTKHNKKIFLCWSDCKEEMIEILLHYLHHFKNFSFKAASKFLNLKPH